MRKGALAILTTGALLLLVDARQKPKSFEQAGRRKVAAVSYTHLTLPTNREV